MCHPLHGWSRAAFRLRLAPFVPFLAGGAGCPLQGPVQDGNVGVDTGSVPGLRITGEPNDRFNESLDVIFDANGRARLQGNISTLNDIDIYALGPLAEGDRIMIDVGTSGGSQLDAAVAVFDALERVVFENDDRNLDLNQLDPFINTILGRQSSAFFLAIVASPLGLSVGGYDIILSIVRGGQRATPVPQMIVLDFDGGTVVIPGDQTHTIGPFDSGDISASYAGQTAAVRDQIAATVRENYEGLGIDMLVVPGASLPTGCSFSSLFFGGRNSDAFGISQSVDSENRNRCDDAIVFTSLFTPSVFRRVLTAVELGVAIGNVASHEIGHLLGLNHVAEPEDLMDTVGAPPTFLFDQEFLSSPFDESVFPIGLQDGFLLLRETIGTMP